MRQLEQGSNYRLMLKVFLSSDHSTAATGKTVAIKLSKNGGSFSNPNAGATNATEVANGWYYVDLDSTDLNTLGDLVVRGTASACDDSEQVCQIIYTPDLFWGVDISSGYAGTQAANVLYQTYLATGQVTDLWQLHGLDIANPMTVTPTLRTSGTISQTISGDGTTTSTVTRTA